VAIAFAIETSRRRSTQMISAATNAAYEQVAIGQTEDDVRRLLGSATGTVRETLITNLFDDSACTRLRPANAQYFYRHPLPSFIIYFDAHKRVVCKEARLLAVHVH
jgi:hypothetical protein